MAQSGYTPIQLYRTTTPSTAPVAGNLAAGELAINTADGKLFYKDASNNVQVIATKDAAAGTFTNLAYTGTLTGGTGVINIGSGQIYKDASGNVGIGTSSLSGRLTIFGVTGDSNGIHLKTSGWPYTTRIGSNGTSGGTFYISQNWNAQSNTVESSTYGTCAVSLDLGYIRFLTGDANAAPSTRVAIDNNGNIQNTVGKWIGNSAGASYLPDDGVIGGSIRNGGAFFITTGGSERMRIDASGNVGIGVTPSAWGAAYPGRIQGLGWAIATPLDGGTDTSAFATNAYNSSGSTWNYRNNASAALYQQLSGSHRWYTAPSGTAGNAITFTQTMTLDSSGNLLVGTTDPGSTSGVGFKVLHSATIPGCYTIMNTAAGGNSFHLYNTNATNNGFRFYVGVNGGIVNYSGNNVNLSDQRMKTDIEAAGDYLQKICAIPVRTFRYKDQGDTDTEKTLGVIAQEVEAIAPELVNNDGFGITPDDGVPLKTIYQTDLQYALMKCIQEQQAMIQELNAKVEQLEAQIAGSAA